MSEPDSRIRFGVWAPSFEARELFPQAGLASICAGYSFKSNVMKLLERQKVRIQVVSCLKMLPSGGTDNSWLIQRQVLSSSIDRGTYEVKDHGKCRIPRQCCTSLLLGRSIGEQMSEKGIG